MSYLVLSCLVSSSLVLSSLLLPCLVFSSVLLCCLVLSRLGNCLGSFLVVLGGSFGVIFGRLGVFLGSWEGLGVLLGGLGRG